MTIENHIENLKKLKSFHNGSYGADIDRAIKALEPCEDAISRQAVLKIIDGWYDNNRDTENIEDLIILITYMSPVKPQEPKTGHWIAEENEEMETIGYYCSECDLPMETEKRTDFCPNCGAKMESEGT